MPGSASRRASVPTSTIRYYERRGLLSADVRQSGQRRYRTETLRRLVFIGMMQDIGLALDEVRVILDAGSPGPAPRSRTEAAVPVRNGLGLRPAAE